MILFIDDERDFNYVCSLRYREKAMLPNFNEDQRRYIAANRRNVHVARNYDEAIAYLSSNVYDLIFFDHDLGENSKTGKDIANWIVRNITKPFDFYVHSANIVGRENIRSLMQQFNDHLKSLDEV